MISLMEKKRGADIGLVVKMLRRLHDGVPEGVGIELRAYTWVCIVLDHVSGLCQSCVITKSPYVTKFSSKIMKKTKV